MSAAMERRLRKIYKEGGTSQTMKSIITGSARKKKLNLSPVSDVSSSSKKSRRKIRCTEELNHLQMLSFSEDSDKTPMKKSKKTKKTTATYRLPSISLIEDSETNREVPSRSSCDSDVEIVVKKKQKRKPKKKSPKKSGGSETDWEEKYVERVKQLIYGTNKDADTNGKPNRLSRKNSSTPYPKRKPENPRNESKKIKNNTPKKSMEKTSEKTSSISIENENLDVDFDSDDVFETTLKNQATATEKSSCNQSNDLSVTTKPGKSVQVQSSHNAVFKFKPSECSSGIKSPRRISARKPLKTPRKSIKEQENTSKLAETVPVVLNSEKLNKKDVCAEVKRQSTLSKKSIGKNKQCVTNTSVCDDSTCVIIDETFEKVEDLSKCSVQLDNTANILLDSSKMGKIFDDSLDLINTSMPWREEDCDETFINSNMNVSKQNNSEIIPENAPLRRTSTFTIADESKTQTINLPYSPLQLDTSKVNKRRRWDKSRLSVSFLDNSASLSVKNTPKVNRLSELKTRYDSPPSGTSTPLVESKNLSKRDVLKGKGSVKERAEEPLPKFRTKLPNFALIHQRAFDKLENIKEMSERKAARARLLLSGHKPPVEDASHNSSKRKELKFSPTRKENDKSLNRSDISVTKIKNVSPSTSQKAANKENRLTPLEKKRELLKQKSNIPKIAKPVVVAGAKKGFTRFGFKLGPDSVKTTTKEEQVKAVASKSKILKNTLEERRTAIQGVRSNRRFELLMQMRRK